MPSIESINIRLNKILRKKFSKQRRKKLNKDGINTPSLHKINVLKIKCNYRNTVCQKIQNN